MTSKGKAMKMPCVYILASGEYGTLYTGVTSNLLARIWVHKNDLSEGFSKAYLTHRLVLVEFHPTMESAIQREKRIKRWNRDWKLRLIKKVNPEWRDLYGDFSVLG